MTSSLIAIRLTTLIAALALSSGVGTAAYAATPAAPAATPTTYTMASAAPAPADYPYPTLSTAGMPDDMVSELLQNGFTGDAPELADVTVLYGPSYIDVENMDEWTVGVYFGLGYDGDPTDGTDRLYAPADPSTPNYVIYEDVQS